MFIVLEPEAMGAHSNSPAWTRGALRSLFLSSWLKQKSYLLSALGRDPALSVICKQVVAVRAG